MAAAAYNLAVLVGKRDLDESCSLCRQALKLRPAEPKYVHTLAFFLREKGDILSQRGDTKGAAALYRQAAAIPGLPPEDRKQLEAKARAIR